MNSEVKATIISSTFSRPVGFYLSGFFNVPHDKYFYVFLCFVYIMTVIGNGFLLSVIYLVKTLQTPKYMIVFSLAFTDVCGSTALIPKVLDTFLFDKRYIVYEECLSHMFFVYIFTFMQSWTLVIMAFDRFIAICFPLRYHSIVTKKSVFAMLLFSWMFMLSVAATVVVFLDRLSFCGSLVIQNFFCSNGPIYRLACNDVSYSFMVAYVALFSAVFIPFVLIIVTYVCISIALSRITSTDQRRKALKTCTSHLIIVACFFLPVTGTNIAALTSYIHPNARIINASLTQTIPPLLNPIIYSLKTEEVMSAAKRIFKRNTVNSVTLWKNY